MVRLVQRLVFVDGFIRNKKTGWWFGTFGLFSPIVGMMIQSD